MAQEGIALAEARGNESRLTHQLSALLAYAKSLFQKETALRRDQIHQKHLLLDQITEQLKSQLQSMENGGSATRDHHAQPLTLGRAK